LYRSGSPEPVQHSQAGGRNPDRNRGARLRSSQLARASAPSVAPGDCSRMVETLAGRVA